MRRQVVFMDLDSTLCSTWGRKDLINWDDPDSTDWLAYAMACEDDEIFEGVRTLAYDMANGYCFVLVTGRPEAAREPTVRWLRKHRVHFDALVMRPEGRDGESNDQTKISLIEQWLEEHPGDELHLLIDDWPAIVEPARERGWPLLLVNPNYPIEESRSNRQKLQRLPV